MAVEQVIGEVLRIALGAGLVSWVQVLALVLIVALVIVAQRAGIILPTTPLPPVPEAPPMDMERGPDGLPGPLPLPQGPKIPPDP